MNKPKSAASSLLTAVLLTFAIAACSGSSVPSVILPPSFTMYANPDSLAYPGVITLGSDGALWFVENAQAYGEVYRITTAGIITRVSVGPFDSNEGDITAGPDGALWYSILNICCEGIAIARLTTSGSVTQFNLPPNSIPTYMAPGPGNEVWFIDAGTKSIGRITTAGIITEVPNPLAGNRSDGIALGPDGAIWFTNFVGSNSSNGQVIASNSIIGRITAAGVVTRYPLSASGAGPGAIVAGSDGALWFTEEAASRIGRITTSGKFSDFSLPRQGTNASFLRRGPDSALWFIAASPAAGTASLDSVTSAGAITEVLLPTWAQMANGLASSADGSLWITAGGPIARFKP